MKNGKGENVQGDEEDEDEDEADKNAEKFQMILKEINDKCVCLDHVTRTPHDVMTSIFKLQGVHIDPSDIETVAAKIVDFVGSDYGCDGEETFDCFINYRVATDQNTAEKLYYALRDLGLYPFFDKKCLKNGMDWK